mgnify:CR=1 FL=1
MEILNYLVALTNDLKISYRIFERNELYLLGNLIILHKEKVENSWHQFDLTYEEPVSFTLINPKLSSTFKKVQVNF